MFGSIHKRSGIVCGLLLILFPAALAVAQDSASKAPPSDPPGLMPPSVEGIVPFLEPSYMAMPKDGLWFEADVGMHFTIFRNGFFQFLRKR